MLNSRRTALVGGGGSGIGFAAAECLARDGHDLVLAGRSQERLDKAAATLAERTGAGVSTVVADLAVDVPRVTAAADVLLLNTGGPPPGRILTVDDHGWQSAFDLLLRGPLRLARTALPAMAGRGFGRVVFVTSTAVRQPQPDLATSVVLRAAVTSAAKLLSREYAGRGVTVNCVAPGPTATERRRQVLSARAGNYADLDAADVATVPAGRAGQPEEVGAAVAFLASAAASYVNGTVLTVDGGRTETP
ncbi:SDR family oxidoreductase [Paractinoplanes brasiliensis]|uniref:3-oxoacyl-[acyl-carrier protein] reductase n=1 Tax=Paractinoplanes brasiliensis TaxID=52695 RepID=A0A4R6JLL0_9ACTN|nr:SDR family oxidoreductase [Actinoplanes brasiliensis]TDO37243.1 3-oxoacyl-[acyl-carrier protein] reductase [Actinoplanes brasiliensis]GID29444.1 3-oxoacyl-ACP reductase [Actinoplanes brasiliensis]